MKTLKVQPVKFNQVLTFVRQLSEKEKDKLFFTLKNQRLKKLLAKLRKSTKGLSLTFKEITAEVETVRKSRYENKFKK